METSTFEPAVTVSDVSGGILFSVLSRVVKIVVTSSVFLEVFGVSVVSGGLVTTAVDDAEFDVDEEVGVMVFDLPDDVTDDVVSDGDDVGDDGIDDVTTAEASDAADDVTANSMNADVYVVCNDGVGEVICSFILPGVGHEFVSKRLKLKVTTLLQLPKGV